MTAALSRRESLRELHDDEPRGSPEDARRLGALARECGASGIGRQVLQLRLSDLPEGRSRPHHLQLAREALLPLTGAARAQLFHLPNQDLVVVWRGETPALRHCLDALSLLFSDDPSFGPDPMSLAVSLTLPDDAEIVLRAVEQSLRPRRAMVKAPTGNLPLEPATLFALERAIAQSEMSRFARREPVCRNGAEGMRLAWERRYLSDSELFDTILPDRAPRADPWLFRRLTRTLDRRMLSLLSATEEVRGVPPFSLDLNVASLLGPEFLRFDANLPTALRGYVILNLRPEDVLSDLASFCFARDFARARGYRLLLGAIEAAQLRLLPPARSGFDFVAIRHDPATAAWTLPIDVDPDGIVLTQCETAGAIAWGKAQGISLFQGRIVTPPRPRRS